MALQFDASEYAARLERLTARMAEQKLDAILEQFKNAEEAEAKLNAENPTDEPELNLDKAEV